MNKFLGNLPTILRSPDVLDAGGGVVTSSPGPSVGASPSTDNFYSDGPVNDGAAPGAKEVLESGKDAREDFTDPVDKSKQFTPIGEQQGEQKLDDAGQPLAQAAAPVVPTLKLDAETIAALRAQVPAAAPVQQKQALGLTPQQLREKLNPVEVSADTLRSFGFENASEEQVAGFQAFANATVKNAVSISRIMIEQARRDVEGSLGPIFAEREQTQLSNAKQTFYDSNKDLAKYEKIVQVAAADVSPRRQDGSFKTDKELMAEVANLARDTLKGYGIQLSSPANPGASGGRLVPQPNKLSPNGRSGGDNNGQRGKANDADADIYAR